jgi:hypothetical protein
MARPTLYGQTAAALYAKAAGQNAQARQLYNASADTYYKANDAASYDDWVRARARVACIVIRVCTCVSSMVLS